MDHRISRPGVIFTIVMAAIAVITFTYLNLAFEGPSAIRGVVGEGYVLEARFHDSEALPTKQPVLLRGVEVGKVKSAEYDPETKRTVMRFTIDDEYAPVYRDAKVAIGERTLLGDGYVRLDPGTEAAGELESGEEVRAVPSVDFDEAFAFLDEKGRGHARAILDELADATRSKRSPTRLNDTIGELARVTSELRDVTGALHGQEEDLAAIVGDSATVLGELGAREDAIRRIVGSGRETLDALASSSDSLERGLDMLPDVADSARSVIAGSRPLLAEAGPLVRELSRAAPELAPVLRDLPSVSADAIDSTAELAALPALRKTLEVVELIGPSVPGVEAATRNLVPLLRYMAPRARSIGAFFANMASVTKNGDSLGRWARFAILLEPGEIIDIPTPATCRPEDDVPINLGVCHNAYPKPDDPLDNEPYEPGSYERLKPFTPKKK